MTGSVSLAYTHSLAVTLQCHDHCLRIMLMYIGGPRHLTPDEGSRLGVLQVSFQQPSEVITYVILYKWIVYSNKTLFIVRWSESFKKVRGLPGGKHGFDPYSANNQNLKHIVAFGRDIRTETEKQAPPSIKQIPIQGFPPV